MSTEETNSKAFTDASTICWRNAVVASANAEDLFIQAHHFWIQCIEDAMEQQQLALTYLALGGFHDKESHQTLGLPFEPGDPSADQYLL